MGTQTSRLIVELINRVSGPARGVKRSLDDLDRSARRFRDRRMGDLSQGLLGGASAAALAKSFKDYAALERRFSRIAITAGASVDEQLAALQRARQIAQDPAMPFESVVEGIEALVAAGRSLPEAMRFLPSVVATAQASGSAVGEIASTADALSTSLEIAADKMQAAFDVLVAGGKAGKFELKDMARFLPSLAPAAAAAGSKGAEGLKQIVAMLQTIRMQSGTSEEAATALTNVLQKMETDETAKKFKKFGVDLRGGMAKARKDGENLIDVFLDLSDKAIKGDLSKLPQLFGDLQVMQGMRALLGLRGEYRKLRTELGEGVDGSTVQDLARIADDAQASLDRIYNSWGRFVTSVGKGLDTAGASSALNQLSADIERAISIYQRAESLTKEPGKALAEAVTDHFRQAQIANSAKLVADQERALAEAKGRLEAFLKDNRGRESHGRYGPRRKTLEDQVEKARSDLAYWTAEAARVKGQAANAQADRERPARDQSAVRDILQKDRQGGRGGRGAARGPRAPEHDPGAGLDGPKPAQNFPGLPPRAAPPDAVAPRPDGERRRSPFDRAMEDAYRRGPGRAASREASGWGGADMSGAVQGADEAETKLRSLSSQAARAAGEIQGSLSGIDFSGALAAEQEKALSQAQSFMARMKSILGQPIQMNIQSQTPSVGGLGKQSSLGGQRSLRSAREAAYENLG